MANTFMENTDFVLLKFKGMLDAMSPAIKDLSEKYIKFVVMKEVLSFYIATALVVFGLMLLVIFSIMRKRTLGECGYTMNGGTNIFVPWIIISAIFSLCCFVALLINSFSYLLATRCPEMFVLHEILSSLSGKR